MREREKEKYEREEKRDEEARKGAEGRRKREEAHIPPTRGGSQRGGPGPGPPPLPKEKKTYRSKVAIRLSTNIDQRPCSTFLSLSLSLLPPLSSSPIDGNSTVVHGFKSIFPETTWISSLASQSPRAKIPPLFLSLFLSPVDRTKIRRKGWSKNGWSCTLYPTPITGHPLVPARDR